DRAQHLRRLLGERDRGYDAGQLGHRELLDPLLHLVDDRTRELAHLDRSRHLERLVEVLGEASPRLRALLGGGLDVQLGGGRVVELVEGGQDGVACRHAPHVHTIGPEANPVRRPRGRRAALLLPARTWQTEPAAWAIPSHGRCPRATRPASTAARWSAASSASRRFATASPSTAAIWPILSHLRENGVEMIHMR